MCRRSLFSAVLWVLVVALPSSAADVQISVIVHPTRAATMTRTNVRAMFLKQKVLWDDGRPILPINLEADSDVRERFSQLVFGQGTRRMAGFWNQRYFEAGEFPPATLASEDAVILYVAANKNAIGYVAKPVLPESVAVVLVLK